MVLVFFELIHNSLYEWIRYDKGIYPVPIHNISGTIPFDEMINVNDGCMSDDPVIKCTLDDLSTSLINSRKIRVNAIINLNLSVEESADQETAISVETEDDVQYTNKK